MPRSALRLAAGIGAAAAVLSAVAPAGAALTPFPGSYREGPTLTVASASGRVWFDAYGLPTEGGDPTSRTAPSRITSAKIVKGNLASLVKLAAIVNPPQPIMDAALVGKKLVVIGCAATCRMVFTKDKSVLSWKPGEAKATTIARTATLYVGAAMTSSGKVVTAYLAGNKLQVRRGTATGAGGKVKKVAIKNGNYGNGAVALVGSRLAVGLAYSKTGDVWRAVGTAVALP